MPPQGRKTPPLFDLLSRNVGQGTGLPRVGNTNTAPPSPPPPPPAQTRTEAPPAQQKPVVRVELKPYQPPIAPPEETFAQPAPETAPSGGFWTQASSGRVMRMPVVAAYALLLGVAGLVLATWAVAYRFGVSKGKEDMAAFVRAGGPPVIEPGTRDVQPTLVSREPTVLDATPQQPSREPKPNTAGTNEQAPPTSASVTLESLLAGADAAGVSGVITSRGFVGQDPRVVGLNYLELATLSRDDCARAVLFLAANGLESIGTPLDAVGRRANNTSPRFRLVAWPGLTADQLREGTPKQSMEREVARLGRVWSQDHKGPTDFRMPQWTKFR